ncbi:hypothetical protein UO65_2336 [Actinokineospora spheciospongiae]|uniref:Carrier domain-containing protein n=1 Tax=Actinokineospora spheciospongiae TaxID=909613 RepID=W7J8K0_9PSEU|nr:phosphopantetheine-binding protein [Actinokineospora spheciospongiae]EWC62349.1 hypothetical protein UO65_2336 [Actinokineospora spheciospongiae]
MLTIADVRAVITSEIRHLLVEAGGDDDPGLDDGGRALHEVGLNSLMLARLLIQLEGEFGVDPFASGEVSIVDVRSLDELAEVYRRAMATPRSVPG